MGLSFVGHTPNFNVWVFNVDGKRLVARNLSTQQPLNIKFAGTFDDRPLNAPTVKTSGFDITDSNASTIIWTWGGKLYTSKWEIDDNDPDNVIIFFSTPIPYTGSPVAPVGTSVKTKDEREAAAAIVPSAQLSTAAAVQQSPMPAKTSVSPTGPNVQFSNKSKEDIEASTAYKSPSYRNQTPVMTSVPQMSYTPSSIGTVATQTIPGTKDAREAAAVTPAGTDWVKLGLQLGAAYLLLA
jgi:hypothetical protein